VRSEVLLAATVFRTDLQMEAADSSETTISTRGVTYQKTVISVFTYMRTSNLKIISYRQYYCSHCSPATLGQAVKRIRDVFDSSHGTPTVPDDDFRGFIQSLQVYTGIVLTLGREHSLQYPLQSLIV
jgi:hypothetical protein